MVHAFLCHARESGNHSEYSQALGDQRLREDDAYYENSAEASGFYLCYVQFQKKCVAQEIQGS